MSVWRPDLPDMTIVFRIMMSIGAGLALIASTGSVAQTLEEARELRRQQASQIVVPCRSLKYPYLQSGTC